MFKRHEEIVALEPVQSANVPLGSISGGSVSGIAPDRRTGDLEKSVIGRDLMIMGSGLKIVCKSLLQVDGEVQGDVAGAKIIVGPKGKVTGQLSAEEVVVEGAVYGTIKAVDVKLKSSAVVEGDVYHETFTLEQGASFEGRSRRSMSREDLLPDFSPLSVGT